MPVETGDLMDRIEYLEATVLKAMHRQAATEIILSVLRLRHKVTMQECEPGLKYLSRTMQPQDAAEVRALLQRSLEADR